MTKKQATILFTKYTPMLHKLSHHCATRCGRPEEEVFGQACYLFMQATRTFDSSRNASFGTHLFTCVGRSLQDWARKYDLPQDPNELPDKADESVADPRKAMIVKEWLENLSQECREVAMIILNGPAEVLDLSASNSARVVRGALWSFLRRKKKWSRPLIWRTFREMKKEVATL